ncbi:MAG: ice-binding family protein [Candidatus Pacearchaeota archaeon]
MEKTKLKFLIFALLSIVIILSVGFVAAAQSAVNLGTAGNFVILAKSGISTTGTTSITGDIGVSPIDSTAITGFGLIMDSSNQFATSSLVIGKVYAADYTEPTPTKMTTAISDMEIAYTDAAGRTLPDYTELGAGNIGGMTLTPGLYKWGTDLIIPTDVTLTGSSTDIWIFQIAQNLDISNGKKVILTGGAQAKNIFWQVAGQTTLGTTSDFKGIILSQTAIVLNTGATLNGRALAQTAVTLDANAVTVSGTASPTTTTAPSSSGSNSGTPASTGSNSNSGNGNNKIIETPVDGKTKLNSYGVKVGTELPVEFKDNVIRITQSNGIKAEIKIMPSTASETALARLRLKICNESNNCTIVLKEVGTGTEKRLVYQVKAQKNVKVLGLFKAKMNVEVNVDAETGKIISEHKPWWASISVDAKEDIKK